MNIVNTLMQFLGGLPHEVAVMIIAMTPIGELRASIPIALTVYDMSVVAAVGYSILGNIVPALLIYWLIAPISAWLSKINKTCNRFFTWLFSRTRKKFSARKYAGYELIALILFIGIPLPMTGAWTGAVAAWLFGMKPQYAIPGFVIGLVLSASIVVSVTFGGIAVLH